MNKVLTVQLRILSNQNVKRFVCTSAGCLVKYGMRQGRFLNKLMVGDVGKRVWHQNKVRPPSTVTSVENLPSRHVTRRVTVLNNLFMQYITDLMATGDASSELLGRSIEVTHVRVTNDFKLVLVYWISKSDDAQQLTEKLLNDCAFSIRHELTQLRVIGRVPLIKFVRNKEYSMLDDVERVIKKADYGEDFEPVHALETAWQAPSLAVKLPPEVREKLMNLEDSEKSLDDDDDCTKFDVNLPPMRHDILGLDRYAIMSRVKASLNKFKEGTQSRILNHQIIYPNSDFNINQLPTHITKNDSKAFAEFLSERKRSERRMLRREKRENFRAQQLHLDDKKYEYDDEVEELGIHDDDTDPFADVDLETYHRDDRLER